MYCMHTRRCAIHQQKSHSKHNCRTTMCTYISQALARTSTANKKKSGWCSVTKSQKFGRCSVLLRSCHTNSSVTETNAQVSARMLDFLGFSCQQRAGMNREVRRTSVCWCTSTSLEFVEAFATLANNVSPPSSGRMTKTSATTICAQQMQFNMHSVAPATGFEVLLVCTGMHFPAKQLGLAVCWLKLVTCAAF